MTAADLGEKTVKQLLAGLSDCSKISDRRFFAKTSVGSGYAGTDCTKKAILISQDRFQSRLKGSRTKMLHHQFDGNCTTEWMMQFLRR